MVNSLVEYEKWDIAYTVLYGVSTLVLLPLFIASIITIRKKKDPARRGFIWFNVALGQTVLGNLILTITSILVILLNLGLYDDGTGSYQRIEILNRLSDCGSLIVNLSYIFTSLMILDVALGILYCWEIGHTMRRRLQWVAYAILVVLAVLVIAKFGVSEAWVTSLLKYYNGPRSRANFPDERLFTARRVMSAILYIALFIVSTGLLALSTVVMVRGRKRAEHHQASILIFVAGFLFWIESVWTLVTVAVWVIPQRPSPGRWESMVDAVLGPWMQLVIFFVVFFIGRKKSGGLWSIPQNDVAKQHHHDDTA